MFYGIVGVSGLAFACSMEMVPEINTSMKLVPFNDEFRTKLTLAMAVDYATCWVIEALLKLGFSDFRPKDIARRRDDQLARERERKQAAQRTREELEEKERMDKVHELEKRLEQRERAIRM